MSGSAISASSLPPRYAPADHEPAVLAKWERSRAFHADPEAVLRGERKPYAVVIPPPNVTDRLHLGHALNNTLQDILVRAHRMMGYEAVWFPGTDHAGIATQTRVDRTEQAAGRPGIAQYKKRELAGENGRAEFMALVQRWKDQYEAEILGQLKRMGCSCDWERTRFTMDSICARAVREAFFRLFRDGLIYRGKRLVNWDPVTQTALADDEVENKEVDGNFYYLRYPMVRGGDGAGTVEWRELQQRGYPAELIPAGVKDTDQAFLTVATTRPETYLGDTAVAVNPRDPRAKSLEGMSVRLPFVGRVIPIVADEYVVMPASISGSADDPKAAFATGFLKVTPAHDENDWAIGQRHGLAVINVMAPDASISKDHGWADVGEAGKFVGLSREDARREVVKAFKAATVPGTELSLMDKVQPYRHSVGHSYRSHVPIEPYLSDQWYLKVTDEKLVGWAQEAAHSRKLRIFPERYEKTYTTWHENLRDWCISRQLWWGHRIPVWRGESSDEIERQIAHWRASDRAFAAASEDGSMFLCVRSAEDVEVISALEKHGFVQDADVLDTWFSSGLWPLSVMGWPDAELAAKESGIADFPGLLGAFNPTNVLCTAREIITLWVSRMVMFNRYFRSPDGGATPGPVPYRDVFIHAMIQDGEGRKMSKSLGNGVDPLDIIHSHGTDAMRFVLCQMTTQTQDVRMPVVRDEATGRNTSPKFDIGRNFCTKLWNAARFALSNLEQCPPPDGPAIGRAELGAADRWMLSRLEATVRAAEESLRDYQFSAYATALYDLLWRDYCDWYLEAVKPTLKTNRAQQAVVRTVLDAILRLLHPIAPFITESLFEAVEASPARPIEGIRLGSGATTLCCSAWPIVDGSVRDEAAEREFARVQGLVEAIRQARTGAGIKSAERPTMHASEAVVAITRIAPGVVEAIAGLGGVQSGPASAGSVEARFEGEPVFLAGVAVAVDPAAERAAFEAAAAKLAKEIDIIEKRLGNPGYVQKAPAHLVEETRAQLAAKVAEREEILRRLGGG